MERHGETRAEEPLEVSDGRNLTLARYREELKTPKTIIGRPRVRQTGSGFKSVLFAEPTSEQRELNLLKLPQ